MSDINEGLQKFMQEGKALRDPDKKTSTTISSKGKGANLGNDTQAIEIQRLREQVRNLTAQNNLNKKTVEQANAETKRLQEHINAQESVKNEKAMNDVMKGFSKDGEKDFFVKDYTFPVEGEEPLKLHIKMKALSAVGMADLEQEVVDLTGGKVKFFDETYKEIAEATMVFRVAGVEVPEWLKDPDKIYRIDIPITIYNDYSVWLQSFRKSRKY